MHRLRVLARLFYIYTIFWRYCLDEFVYALKIFRPLRIFKYINPWRWFLKPEDTRAVRLRKALEKLGPVFIKFGQQLSTRGDILPKDIIRELTILQDAVTPFQHAEAVIAAHYNKPLHDLFAKFDPTPLASASIAQVHGATLLDGRDVIVKVVRPKIEKIIVRDIGLLYTIARLAERYWADGPRLHPVDVVAEFDNTIHQELDLVAEAANASQLKRNFKSATNIYVPDIIWPLTQHAVMVQERIYGIPILDIPALESAGFDLKKLAETGVSIFFTQVFRDCFFHADMHPGNIFVCPKDVSNPKFIVVDFGIMGTLTPNDQTYLAENFIAFFNRDYRRVSQLHIDSGWVDPNTKVDQFETAIRTICEPVFERPLKDISIAKILLKLFQTARRFNMELQPQLTLLQKTLLNVEGLGRTLYPDLDLWATAKPFLENWMRTRVGVKPMLKTIRKKMPYWLAAFPELPELLYYNLKHSVSPPPRVVNGRLPYPDQIKKLKRRCFISGSLITVSILAAGIALYYFIQ